MPQDLNACPQCGSAFRVLASVDHSDLKIVRVICQNQECESLWWVSYLPQNIPSGLASKLPSDSSTYDNEIRLLTPEMVREMKPCRGLTQQEINELANILAEEGFGGREEIKEGISPLHVVIERALWLRQQKAEGNR